MGKINHQFSHTIVASVHLQAALLQFLTIDGACRMAHHLIPPFVSLPMGKHMRAQTHTHTNTCTPPCCQVSSWYMGSSNPTTRPKAGHTLVLVSIILVSSPASSAQILHITLTGVPSDLFSGLSLSTQSPSPNPVRYSSLFPTENRH